MNNGYTENIEFKRPKLYSYIIGELQYFPVFACVSIEYCIRIQKCDSPSIILLNTTL